MMKYVPFIFLFVCIPAFASNTVDSANLFQWFIDVADHVDRFFEYTPSFIERMYSYVIKYAIKLKLVMMLESMKFAHGVATELLNDLSIYQFVDASFSSLSPDIRGAAAAYGVGSGLMRIIEAMTTRFVMDFMGV